MISLLLCLTSSYRHLLPNQHHHRYHHHHHLFNPHHISQSQSWTLVFGWLGVFSESESHTITRNCAVVHMMCFTPSLLFFHHVQSWFSLSTHMLTVNSHVLYLLNYSMPFSHHVRQLLACNLSFAQHQYSLMYTIMHSSCSSRYSSRYWPFGFISHSIGWVPWRMWGLSAQVRKVLASNCPILSSGLN